MPTDLHDIDAVLHRWRPAHSDRPEGTLAFRSVRERSGVYQVAEIGSVVTWDVSLTDVRQKGEGRCLRPRS